jgi:hypothetical protein
MANYSGVENTKARDFSKKGVLQLKKSSYIRGHWGQGCQILFFGIIYQFKNHGVHP